MLTHQKAMNNFVTIDLIVNLEGHLFVALWLINFSVIQYTR